MEVLRAYACAGRLSYDHDPSIECTATATQLHDGELRFDLGPVHSSSGRWLAEGLSGQGPIRFEGQTTDGMPVVMSGVFRPINVHWNAAEGVSQTYSVESRRGSRVSLEVGTRSEQSDAEWRFGLANLLFEAPNATVHEDGSADRGVLSLTLADQIVRLQRRSDYLDSEKRLSRGTTRTTAEACVSAALSFPAAQELVADLSALLSIADGTLISWIYCDQVTRSGERVFSFHYPAVTRPHNSALPLISPEPSTDLPLFLETTFQRFRAKREEWRLWRFSRAYADIRTTGFLETRCFTSGLSH
jgi:hypothetical protein